MKDENTFFLDKVALSIRSYLETNSLERCEFLKYKVDTNEFVVLEEEEGFSRFIGLDVLRVLRNFRDEKIDILSELGNEVESFIASEEAFALEEVAATSVSEKELTDIGLISNIYNTLSTDFSYDKEIQGQVSVIEECRSSFDNHIDNVVMLKSIYDVLSKETKNDTPLVEQMKQSINEKLFNVVLDLANVDNLKYELVKNPIYHRRIHNGQRFNSPFMLVYWLCKIQREFHVLNKQGEVVLRRIIKCGYEKLTELKSYEIGLLLSSTTMGYDKDVQAAKEELLKRVNQDGSWNTEGIILEDTEDMIFLGSSLYTTVICIEGLYTGGTKSFGDFHDEKMKPTHSESQISKEISIDTDRFMDFNGNRIYMTIENDYMKPALEKKDEIQVELCTEAEKEDIVVFMNQRGELVAHRVTEVLEDEATIVFITATEDKSEFGYPVFQREILGRVVDISKMEVQR